MRTILVLLAVCIAAVACLPRQQGRIVGGNVTNIELYPFAISLQVTHNNIVFTHVCGGTIINNRSALCSAHCFIDVPEPNRYRTRAGSANRVNFGTLHRVSHLFGHPLYNPFNHDNDIGVLRVATPFPVGTATVQVANIAGPNFPIPDNASVRAIGWGFTHTTGFLSNQLRHVELFTVNQERCNSDFEGIITDNMLCARYENGGRGICFGDSGTGLVMNNVVVGINSFIGWDGCGSPRWPNVFARVSRYIQWIQGHA